MLVLADDTVTVQAAVFVPLAVEAVIVAVPAAIGVTVPELFTVATLVLLEVHVTVLFVAFDGVTVAVSVSLELPAVR